MAEDALRDELNKAHERAGMTTLVSRLLINFLHKDSYSRYEVRKIIFDTVNEIMNEQDAHKLIPKVNINNQTTTQ